MNESTKSPAVEGPMNASGWLSADTAGVFRRHVPDGRRSAYVRDAVVERMQREGAFDAKHPSSVAKVLAAVPPAALPLLAEVAELIATSGAESIAALIAPLKQQALEAAGSASR